jgi:hypothetical protein
VAVRHEMRKKCGEQSKLAATDGIEGLEGTAPITVVPLELVFNTDEVVLHMQFQSKNLLICW